MPRCPIQICPYCGKQNRVGVAVVFCFILLPDTNFRHTVKRSGADPCKGYISWYQKQTSNQYNNIIGYDSTLTNVKTVRLVEQMPTYRNCLLYH